jgi:hypothetical protein
MASQRSINTTELQLARRQTVRAQRTAIEGDIPHFELCRGNSVTDEGTPYHGPDSEWSKKRENQGWNRCQDMARL